MRLGRADAVTIAIDVAFWSVCSLAWMVWLRRLSLEFGSAGLSATITLSIYMGGLGIGSIWSSTYHWKKPTQGYGLLRLFVALWGFYLSILATLSITFFHWQ